MVNSARALFDDAVLPLFEQRRGDWIAAARAAARAIAAARREGQDMQFTKTPASWLAQQCWLDDVPAAAAPVDGDAMAAMWDGQAAPLVAEIGAASFQAFFAGSDFAAGPPAKICVAAPYLRDLIARKFSQSLRRAYGECALDILTKEDGS